MIDRAWKRWVVIAFCTVLGGICGRLYVSTLTPRYIISESIVPASIDSFASDRPLNTVSGLYAAVVSEHIYSSAISKYDRSSIYAYVDTASRSIHLSVVSPSIPDATRNLNYVADTLAIISRTWSDSFPDKHALFKRTSMTIPAMIYPNIRANIALFSFLGFLIGASSCYAINLGK